MCAYLFILAIICPMAKHWSNKQQHPKLVCKLRKSMLQQKGYSLGLSPSPSLSLTHSLTQINQSLNYWCDHSLAHFLVITKKVCIGSLANSLWSSLVLSLCLSLSLCVSVSVSLCLCLCLSLSLYVSVSLSLCLCLSLSMSLSLSLSLSLSIPLFLALSFCSLSLSLPTSFLLSVSLSSSVSPSL